MPQHNYGNDNGGDEAQRWKRKFLDALEDQEQREKLLNSRIKLLRRGLLGVSLAGDGHAPQLDRQLAELRKTLRNDDREVGLELLLEQIEKSIIRLDNEKNASNVALQQAFVSSIAELDKLPLPKTTRRQLRKFSQNLSARLDDTQQHAGLIRQFIDILREAVQSMIEQEQKREQAARGDDSGQSAGFWKRMFGSSDSSDTNASTEPPSGEIVSNALDGQESGAGSRDEALQLDDSLQAQQSAPMHKTSQSQETQRQQNSAAAAANGSAVKLQSDGLQAQADHEPSDSSTTANGANAQQDGYRERDHALHLQVQAEVVVEEEDDASIEGELVRDRSGLSEPAFSYIAGHVEPILLRILEAIHISSESYSIVDAVRRNILKGLNWYDFVAVLEEILHILRTAADQQRTEFQTFLSDVTESLAQVQAFVDNAKAQAVSSAESDAEMDSQVRGQVEDIARAVQNDSLDITGLRQSVQSQIDGILKSLDGFKHQRSREHTEATQEMGDLIERIAALESESRELRVHLSRQQSAAATDTLTELPNRSAYNERIRVLLGQWQRQPDRPSQQEDRALCLAVLDVDHFKNINDSFGHLAGDKVLKIIAREIAARLREQDFVARYGGEEFVILLPDIRPPDAEYTLNRLREAISAIPFHFREEKVEITVSIGVVPAQRDDTPETLFDRADQSLYQAKQSGRNRVIRPR
ncbi:GGDEF domain-containing protein [Pseudohongiella sp. O18]|uniref:GGDEF domain-containing protein n=1 Tax=Pseudohongiella sp. O18 TaxID=2904248 RepID=UPI001F3B5051|nr:GGDEF domain-containing protein [Pseudohongiella sp. O18]